MESSSRVVAELGPTNTGKTWRAIERMLEHQSGMIGLPLRLLAREVYERVTARVGEARVALVTGEEKRVPAHPSYWVCTVEAMPLGQPVDFLSVDEIQLCAHRERGHVFSERLLYARGRLETWFLGSESMRPALRALIPQVTFRRSERLSQLRSFGSCSLKGLAPRSAVVAFSTERVYELAHALRQLRGGVAVVLGGLSPRTRNAQVAMYQAGEVQYLVATDAIGMGLNLDLERIAFASLTKFDGFEVRALAIDELGQIAGRAGRHVQAGQFGTLTSAPALSPRVISAIEAHRFPDVQRLVWRSVALDFASPHALLDSLAAAPGHALFTRVERADDFDTLKALASDDEVALRATDAAHVALLWDVCRIPDFRKGLLGEHVRIVKDVFLQLAEGDGRLNEDWLRRKVEPLDDLKGDLHTLTARLEAIRTWTYISHRSEWMSHAPFWQNKTRAIEDALGDALHQRLVERFVQRSTQGPWRRRASAAAVPMTGPFAQLARLVQTGPTLESFVERAVDARNEALHLDEEGRVSFEGETFGKLVRGSDRLNPGVALVDGDAWNGGQRVRLERRLTACARDAVAEAMGGFPVDTLTAEHRTAPLRAIAWRFAYGLGIVPRDASLLEQVRLLDTESHRTLDELGVRQGARFLLIAGAVIPTALERRVMLTALFEGRPRPEGIPAAPVVRRAVLGGRDALAWGYECLGPFAVRIDVLEGILAALGDPRRLEHAFTALGVDPAIRPAVVRQVKQGIRGR
jgi:ATP-dependent RNA helicase SUPV3L1/SUV3